MADDANVPVLSTDSTVNSALNSNTLQSPNMAAANAKQPRRVICRYGRGCTHIMDPVHKERFWHPYIPQLTGKF